jgi:predicted house-cleaning noncanonical NTP pyrophosphatase (MazG superfamily)
MLSCEAKVTMLYNKLVRDQIPEIIKEKGKTPIIHIADEREYVKKLEEKLTEEVQEFLFAKSVEEMADVLEVLEALSQVRGFSMQEVEIYRKQKAEKSGKFLKRIVLEEVK